MYGYTSLCTQCGFSHPPLKEGELCPMAKVKTNDGNDIDLTNFFTSLKSILISQISKKNIKDPKKILSFTIVMITKLLEKYEEK
jgi:hypothetical protein